MEPDRSPAESWLGVELRHLAALQAVAAEGSFGRAAVELGYTQSAVSQQIATLERIVGERLIERPGGPRPVTLTEAGRLLLRHAESIMARLQAAQADLAALSSGAAGTLRVGTFQSVGKKVLPKVMRRFQESWPDVDIELRESHSDLELAASPLGGRDRVPTLREIAEQPLLGFRECRSTEIVADQLRATGREPRFVFRSDDNGIVQGLAAAGVGVAVVPLLTVDENDDTIETIPLGTRIAPRIVGIAWHTDRYHSAAARAFVETAQAVASETIAALSQAA